MHKFAPKKLQISPYFLYYFTPNLKFTNSPLIKKILNFPLKIKFKHIPPMINYNFAPNYLQFCP